MTPQAGGDMSTGCPCWSHNSALGHEGHCCFLNDSRMTWRPDAEVCHIPTDPGSSEPVASPTA